MKILQLLWNVKVPHCVRRSPQRALFSDSPRRALVKWSESVTKVLFSHAHEKTDRNRGKPQSGFSKI
jgi:hypothetical protein